MRSNKNRRLTLQARKAIIGRIFVYPWFLATLVFALIPLIMSLIYTFNNMTISDGGGYELISVGTANYIKAFTQDTFFVEYFLIFLRDIAIKIPLILLFSLFVAVLLNQKFKGRGLMRSIFFLPVVITSSALVYALNVGVSEQIGNATSATMLNNWQIGEMLKMVLPFESLVNTIVMILDQIFAIIWASGIQILIFLAALQSVPVSLYESAKVDGATGWEMFWKITLPMVLPMFTVNVIFTIIDTYSDYGNQLLRYIINTTMGATQTFGSTIAWIFFAAMFLVIMLLMLLLNRIGKKYN